MTSSFMGLGVFIVCLPVLIGQWIGIIGLGKARKDGAWWCMVSGISCTTLGAISSVIFLGLLMTSSFHVSSGFPSANYAFATVGASGLSGLGSLLFAIGFAIHGQRAAKSQDRIAELEAIAAAQGAELNRLRAS